MNGLPQRYGTMEQRELRERISKRKEELGDRLVILGHHYQRQEIIDFADVRGDSLALSQRAAEQSRSEFIVFCGVHFMAESAEILRKEHQRVQHPNPEAGCPLADMVELGQARVAWEAVTAVVGQGNVVPVTYMNSRADIKAFCGARGGAVCTSSNAARVFEWVLGQGKRVLFFPDEHLGRNSARRVGVEREKVFLWDPLRSAADGEVAAKIEQATLILWKGFCHVHTHFTLEHVREARARSPEARIIVHPECPEAVASAADAMGSTDQMFAYVDAAPAGATVYIGTEINLVERLAREHPDKAILPLSRSTCPDMSRIGLPELLWTLEEIGEVQRVYVDPETKEHARKALERMIRLA